MKIIKTEFVHDEKEDHHANGYPGCQSENVDQGKHLAFYQVSPGYFQIIFEHAGNLDRLSSKRVPVFLSLDSHYVMSEGRAGVSAFDTASARKGCHGVLQKDPEIRQGS
jgi:hypothetical protein